MTVANGSPKRIVMVAPTPFFADRGGHVRILGEASALIALGNQLVLCTYPLGRNIEGIPTTRTLAVPWYKKLSPGPSVHKFYIDLLLLWKVLMTCYRFRPDVIHAHLHEGIAIGKIASKVYGVPLVADLQGSLTGELLDHKFIPRAPWLIKLLHRTEKTINQMPHHLIASSTQTARNCIEAFGFSPQQVSTVMDGVDLEVFAPQKYDAALQASLDIASDDRVVVFIGVLTEYQGIDLLLEAVPLIVKEFPRVKYLEARNEVQHAFSSHENLKQVFGYVAGYQLEEGVKRMARWARRVGAKRSKVFNNIEVMKNMPRSWRAELALED